MRTLRSFGLIVIAGVAALALFQSSASALSTQLCTNLFGGCEEPGTVHFVSSKVEWLNSLINIDCLGGLITGTVLKGLALSSPVRIHVALAGLTYSGCNALCTVKVLKGGEVTILRKFTELGEVNLSGFQVNLKCLSFINCTYNMAVLGHGLGTPEGKLHITFSGSSMKSESGGLCPETTLLDALFESLTPIYIGA